jgi:putative peptidoglycan lipid II flippase
MPSTFKSASKIMVAVMGSRVLGLLREMLLNALFGAGKELDALIAAFRLPNLLRDLFAEGALSTAFVTTFSKKLSTENKEAAFRLANLVLTTLLLFMLLVVLLGIIFSDALIHLTNPGFLKIEGKHELTVQLTRILFPFILLVSLAAVYMGLLNSLGRFGLPATASSAFNLVSILSGLALGWWMDPSFGPSSIYGFAIGTVIGGVAQLLIQVPQAIQLGYRFRWNFNLRDPSLRQVFLLMAPAIVGGAAVQINVLVNGTFASYLGDGAVTYLYNAFRLVQLPIGLFGVAIATVTLPSVSGSAALADLNSFRAKIQEGLQLLFFFSLPAALGCTVLAEPIIRLIYERGAFTSADTEQTALMLQAFSLGLAAYAGIKVLAPAFYALNLARIPLRISLIGIGLNFGLNLFFLKVLKLGLASLPLATSLVAIINFSQLAFALRPQLKGLSDGNLGKNFLKTLLASLLMGASLLLLWLALPNTANPWLHAAFLFSAIFLGMLIYFGCCHFLKVPEYLSLLGTLQRRLARSS